LANVAHEVLPLCAGPERSVAATKTYIASVSAILQLIAFWSGDSDLTFALSDLPTMLANAWALDWSPALAPLKPANDLYVIGRGVGFGAAQEASLKFKETCGLHAEAFSAAEVQHGPMALVKSGFPVLVFAQDDETLPGIAETAAQLAGRDATMLLAGLGQADAVNLPTLHAHPVLQPVLTIQSFYRRTNALSLARGFDPDNPPHLNKITETI
jgi:glutamine---fructose-6-phosphate transaminase (isomerizing)